MVRLDTLIRALKIQKFAFFFLILFSSFAAQAQTYRLQQWPAGTSANEGSTADFSVTTTGVATGTVLSYTISGGVSAADIGTGSLTGSTTVSSNGVASISIPIVADNLTEWPETLTVSVQGQSSSIIINDISRSFADQTTSTRMIYALEIQQFAGALYNVTVGSAAMGQLQSETTSAGSAGLEWVLNRYYASSFGGQSSQAVGELVAANLGLRDEAAQAAANYLRQALDSKPVTSGGEVILDTVRLFGGLIADPTFGRAARTWNARMDKALEYRGTVNIAGPPPGL